ncbi:unnamed protein product [Microthlaspi erraticum]|uniref:MULE transposase domain-containing protein n=1 Tax=Microthlaspi erraticum TaxID=1685480 RepID=A0A6D2JXK4_9BRAS|nr:unnamed protein product [Microthlaspi erraticum]
MENAHGSIAGSYTILPAYLALLQRTNPGSIFFLDHVEEPLGGSRFKFAFIAYGASIAGFPYMRKVIVVNGASLKWWYGGCLLSACAQDANFQIFPLAFAIFDYENDASWQWFMSKLNILSRIRRTWSSSPTGTKAFTHELTRPEMHTLSPPRPQPCLLP